MSTLHQRHQSIFTTLFTFSRFLVHYLHNLQPEPIAHRDLKPHNILLDEDFTPIIMDLGIIDSILITDTSKMLDLKMHAIQMLEWALFKDTWGILIPDFRIWDTFKILSN
jgi:serine/threonine protein kinase